MLFDSGQVWKEHLSTGTHWITRTFCCRRPLHAMPVLPTVDRVAEHLKCGIVLEQVDGVVDGLGAVR